MTARGRIVGGTVASVLALATPGIAYFEGMVPHTYADPVGIPTACFGHTGPDVTPGATYSRAQCDAWLDGDAGHALDAVLDCVRIDLHPWEAAALTSFTVNVGRRALCTSTLARMANIGAPAFQWCAQMARWVKATYLGLKITLPGLVTRRSKERAMCMGDVTAFAAPGGAA